MLLPPPSPSTAHTPTLGTTTTRAADCIPHVLSLTLFPYPPTRPSHPAQPNPNPPHALDGADNDDDDDDG